MCTSATIIFSLHHLSASILIPNLVWSETFCVSSSRQTKRREEAMHCRLSMLTFHEERYDIVSGLSENSLSFASSPCCLHNQALNLSTLTIDQTCLSDMQGFLSWCQASAHLLLNIGCSSLLWDGNRCDDDGHHSGNDDINSDSPLCSSKIGNSVVFCHRTSPMELSKIKHTITSFRPNLSASSQMSCSDEKTFSTGSHFPPHFTGTVQGEVSVANFIWIWICDRF